MTGRKTFALLCAWIACAALWAGGAQAQTLSRARVIHAAPERPAADVYINGELALAELSYGASSAPFSLPAGPAELRVTNAGSTAQQILQAIYLEGDAFAIALTDNAHEPVRIIPEDRSPLDFGRARLSIVNALDDDSAIEISSSQDERLTGEGVEAGASTGSSELPAGPFEFSLRLSGAAGAPARHDFSVTLPAGTSNLLVIHGDAGKPLLLRATAAVDADNASGRVRFVHAVQGAAPIDLKINDQMIVPSLAFAQPSEHIAIPGGSHQLALSLGGTAISSTNLDVVTSQLHTVVIMGSPASLKPVAYRDSLRDLTVSSAIVNLINAVPNSSVNLLRLESGAIVAAGVEFGDEGGAARIVPGKQSMTMMLEIGDESGNIFVPSRDYFAGSYYNLIALSGTAFTAPRLLVAETSLMRRITAAAPAMASAAKEETETRAAAPTAEAHEADEMAQSAEAPSTETANAMDAVEPSESSTATEAISPSDPAGEPDAAADAGPSLVMGPYAVVNLDPNARLQLRQFPSSDAMSLGLLPGGSDLTVLGRRGLTQYLAGETSDLPVNLSDYKTDPAAELYPAQDLRPADTWLFVMYRTEDSGALVGWVNAYYLQVFDEAGGTQRLASLPMVRQNRAGSTLNTEMRPPELSDHISARVYGLDHDAMLNLRMANNPDSEVILQLAPNSPLSLVGFDEADEWAFVDYTRDTGEIARGWVSTAFVQLLLNGEPVRVNTIRALDETIAPHVSSLLRGSIRSAEATGPTPIPLAEDLMTGVVGEVILDPGAMLHLRRHPSVAAESLALIPAGSKVAISGVTKNAEWLKTSYADKEGWVAAHYMALLLRGRLYHRNYVESLLPPHDNAGNPSG